MHRHKASTLSKQWGPLFRMGKATTLVKWFPVLPFIFYWIMSILAYVFGPFMNPVLSTYTYLYIFSMLVSFIIAYNFGLHVRLAGNDNRFSYDDRLPLKILNTTSQLAFIATLLFVIDRIVSGAGSLDLVINEMSKVRSDYVFRTTLITTIAVLPQSLKTIAFAAYFYCLSNKTRIRKKTHLMIFGIILFELCNMVLTTTRGHLFWYGTYFIFYLFFCKRMPLFRTIFSRRYLLSKAFYIFAIIVSFSYFYFVASNRTEESLLESSGKEAYYSIKYKALLERYDNVTIGASEQLFGYITHEFKYIEVFLKNAKMINFDLVSGMGTWVNSQIIRFVPDYVPRSLVIARQWTDSAGLSPYGWASIFGWPLALYGVLGSILFFPLLGLVCGWCVNKFIKTNMFGWFLLTFVVYNSLNISFDWILRTLDQYISVIIAIALIYRNNAKIVIARPTPSSTSPMS